MGKKNNETKQEQQQQQQQQQEPQTEQQQKQQDPQQIEGKFLLGKPKFKKLENGRYKCVETGHELLANGRESYAHTKHCRLGLIDSALARNKPPLNMFNQDPNCRSKLVCKLTGQTVNKIEEHIWKHINGRRFLSMLEKEEAGTGKEEEGGVGKEEEMDYLEVVDSEGKPVYGSEKKKNKKKKNKKKKAEEKDVSEIISEVRDPEEKENESEDEFWIPPVGDRWDFDDGKDRWGSDLESDVDPEDDDDDEIEADDSIEESNEAQELSKRTKRMSIEIEQSDLASQEKKKKKKKKKTEST